MSTQGDGVLIFGGLRTQTEPVLRDVWQLRWDGGALPDTCRDESDPDGDGLAGCMDPDCDAVCSPRCIAGAPCDLPRCGDGVCNDQLENCRICPGDCGACTPVCGDFVCDPGEQCPGECP
jgi:hypothetical protein